MNDEDFSNIFNLEKHFLFGRRQFILGPSIIKSLINWKSLKINNELFLTYHPDLGVDYVRNESKIFVLLGIILDPFHPELSNKEVLLNLSRSGSFEELIENTYHLGGRWIIIYDNANQTNVFHDATGNRQIFFTNVNDKIWCASQPHFIAEYLKINKTEDKEVLDFMNSTLYKEYEHAWIGDGTFYDEIYHLLPNHFLDIRNRKVKRYWPNEKFIMRKIPIEQSIELSSQILQGMIKSVSLRYPILLAVTAGIDSRILLAASKIIKDKVYYFIQEFASNRGSYDINVPKRLLKKLQLEFHVEKCEKIIKDEEFNQFFYKNVAVIQTEAKKVLHYNFYEKFQGKIYISGNVSEIARNYYGVDKNNMTAERLARTYERRLSISYEHTVDKYKLRKIDEWLFEAARIAESSNVSILDLFCWEQDMGNWGAMFAADLDIAIEVIYPFNCRTLLIQLLSVDEKYRLSNNILYKELIKKMWKEALCEPINPVGFNTRILNLINKIIKNTKKQIVY